jgi:hypothetical protein
MKKTLVDKGVVMETFDKVVELKALQSKKDDKNIEVLQYAFLVVMDKNSYKNGTVTTRLALLEEAFNKVNKLVAQKAKSNSK